jgi:hypothetical protein
MRRAGGLFSFAKNFTLRAFVSWPNIRHIFRAEGILRLDYSFVIIQYDFNGFHKRCLDSRANWSGYFFYFETTQAKIDDAGRV